MVQAMTQRVVVIGAGGFGREVVDVVDAINAEAGPRLEVVGFIDDGEPDQEMHRRWGVPCLGGLDALANLDDETEYVIAIGAPGVRRRIAEQIGTSRKAATLIHPMAAVGRYVELGEGTIVCANASLTNEIRLGRHVHVNINSTVGHDARLGDYTTLSPLVAISGNVRAGDGAFFGTGSTVNPGVTVGADAVIGSGAVVLGNIAAGVTAVGIPAKAR